MNTTELKKLVEDAVENGASIYHEFYTAANPAAILKLLQINAELVEVLKGIEHFSDAVEFNSDPLSRGMTQWIKAGRVVLAKAEGGEL